MCSFKLQAGVRFREGEEKVVKSRTKITEREGKHEQRLNYVMTCRRLCEHFEAAQRPHAGRGTVCVQPVHGWRGADGGANVGHLAEAADVCRSRL